MKEMKKKKLRKLVSFPLRNNLIISISTNLKYSTVSSKVTSRT